MAFSASVMAVVRLYLNGLFSAEYWGFPGDVEASMDCLILVGFGLCSKS